MQDVTVETLVSLYLGCGTTVQCELCLCMLRYLGRCHIKDNKINKNESTSNVEHAYDFKTLCISLPKIIEIRLCILDLVHAKVCSVFGETCILARNILLGHSRT